ncbi:hypothetical protein SYNPS1DRAFT_31550 [Syncephalis pseudoplumigaleata]|uniref:Mitochondrial zinc maintenance protein 1, mitochondrial n=1 Tax=Syncephalis pseudoplumigaleata TaxID=1712513 RepID=A0A4V1J0U7_9FUNG|nr:hypothetical protein SYNPS1DRAFT_31550 [Syncephalis pseudoplumigaleata]|eukprot:RKP22799.1 hypothetical protein SYNPS1DRAFT_31550 [Syncephalis pseudoplumigaleata]
MATKHRRVSTRVCSAKYVASIVYCYEHSSTPSRTTVQLSQNLRREGLFATVAARQRTREEFDQLRTETDPDKIQKAVAFGREVASILERNVAQATRMEHKPHTYRK